MDTQSFLTATKKKEKTKTKKSKVISNEELTLKTLFEMIFYSAIALAQIKLPVQAF